MKRTVLLLIILVVIRFLIPFIKAVIRELKNSEENEEKEEREETEETEEIEEDEDEEEYTPGPFSPDTCVEIAKIISHDDEKVIKDMEQLLADPISYLCDDDDLSEFEKKMIREQKVDDGTIWQGMITCLTRNNYACERDWKDELEDFFYFLDNLKYDVKLDKDILDEDGDITEWCARLDKSLQDEGMCIGNMDTGGDSFALFICEIGVLKQLRGMARSIGRRIDCARKM